MAEQIRIVIKSFGRGMASFVGGWNRPFDPPQKDPRGICRYFEVVGGRLSRAAEEFAEEHQEVLQHAN